jgi:hypothetical protein
MSSLTRVTALGMILVLPWTGMILPAPTGMGPGMAAAQDDDDDDDDDDDRPRPRQGNRDDDDDDDDDRPRRPRPGADDDDDDDDRPRPRQGNRDDDDDDDDDRPRPRQSDDDDDDDDAPPRQQVQAAPPPPPPPTETEASGEIVALDLSEDDVAALLAEGYAVIEAREIAELGTLTRRLAVPAGVTIAEARDRVRTLPSGQDADFNHFYRAEQEVVPASAPGPAEGWAAPCDGLHCPAFDQIGWPVAPSRLPACGAPVAIGMIDTGLNADHTTFAGATLEVMRLSDDTLDPSRAVHGTAVAAILVGDPASRSPGLVPWARLVAVDAFHRDGQDERADVVALIEGLGHLADQGVRVINLSLAGPPNTVLQEAIARLVAEEGIVIVAAAGNGGPRAEPAYPAAYDGVIAVTAVDPGDGVYRRAQQGDYVDLAAPGVEVWTAASISGARSKTGTSFAVPFVTAAAALVLQGNPALTPAEVEARLAAGARDLGDPGRDPVYGHGAVMTADLCLAEAVPAPVALSAPTGTIADLARDAGRAAAGIAPAESIAPAPLSAPAAAD